MAYVRENFQFINHKLTNMKNKLLFWIYITAILCLAGCIQNY